ncbi:MAG: NfeD family protein [Chloroflexi bacterium]|nr:NfeD family protein [Chloroflexota bacterium]
MTIDAFFWGWLILALFLFLAEIFTAGFVLAAFGVGAMGGALAALVGLALPWQILLFVMVSVIAVIYSRRFAERVSGEMSVKVGVDRVLGQKAIVLETIDPLEATGRVRIEREEWRAESVDGQVIPAETVVEVVGVEGTRVLVRAIKG